MQQQASPFVFKPHLAIVACTSLFSLLQLKFRPKNGTSFLREIRVERKVTGFYRFTVSLSQLLVR